MFTLGATYYLDCEKTWSASALARYETNSERSKIAIRPGDDFHIEWGLGKNINKVWDVGPPRRPQPSLLPRESARQRKVRLSAPPSPILLLLRLDRRVDNGCELSTAPH